MTTITNNTKKTITVVYNQELQIQKIISNPIEAIEAKFHFEEIFGKEFQISVYRDVWHMSMMA